MQKEKPESYFAVFIVNRRRAPRGDFACVLKVKLIGKYMRSGGGMQVKRGQEVCRDAVLQTFCEALFKIVNHI